MLIRKIWLIVIGLVIPVALVLNVQAADSGCVIEDLLQKGHYLRGDVNNDGKVDWNDIQAILGQISAPDSENPYSHADVNGDGKVNYDDEAYLHSYLSGEGPAPCMENVQYCSSSPCMVRVGDAVVELHADLVSQNRSHASWKAVAYNADIYNKKELASFSLNIDYGRQVTTVTLSYRRQNSPFGLADIPLTKVKSSIATPYSEGGNIGQVDTLTTLIGVSALLTARTDASIPHTPSGYSIPVNIPNFFLSEVTDSCFIEHDFCYQRGGNSSDKQACDETLFNCLGISGMTREGFWCGDWIYRKEYIKEFIRFFNSGSFRYHNEEYSCDFHSKGEDIDNLLDKGVLTKDCSSCKGKDTCDATCVVDAGGMPLEYQCFRNLQSNSSSPITKSPLNNFRRGYRGLHR